MHVMGFDVQHVIHCAPSRFQPEFAIAGVSVYANLVCRHVGVAAPNIPMCLVETVQ